MMRAWAVALLLTTCLAASITVVRPATAAPGKALRAAEIELTRAQAAQARQQADSERSSDSWWRVLAPILGPLAGALLTAGVAFLAIVLPLGRQRRQDREQREEAIATEVRQRERELVQRFDVTFATAVASLAGTTEGEQVGGAAALQSFTRKDHAVFHDQVYNVVRAHLDIRVEHGEGVRSVLVATIEKLLEASNAGPTPTSAPRKASDSTPPGADLSSLWLQQANLRDLDLAGADLWKTDLRAARLERSSLRRAHGWKADLSGALLQGCDLEEARFRGATGHRAIFTNARLVSARFEDAELGGARFRGAELQSTHFEGADLRATDFRNARVSDAFFNGADLDDEALASLVLSHDLVRTDPSGRRVFSAHLDFDHRRRLVGLARKRGWDWATVLA